MDAPPPPTACTPSCTSTPARSRSPPSAGRTVSLAAPWGPSWRYRATVAAWVRLAHSYTYGREGSELSRKPSKQETCHNSDISILLTHQRRNTHTHTHTGASPNPVSVAALPSCGSRVWASVKSGAFPRKSWFIWRHQVWSRRCGGGGGGGGLGWFRTAADFQPRAEEESENDGTILETSAAILSPQPSGAFFFSAVSPDEDGRHAAPFSTCYLRHVVLPKCPLLVFSGLKRIRFDSCSGVKYKYSLNLLIYELQHAQHDVPASFFSPCQPPSSVISGSLIPQACGPQKGPNFGGCVLQWRTYWASYWTPAYIKRSKAGQLNRTWMHCVLHSVPIGQSCWRKAGGDGSFIGF